MASLAVDRAVLVADDDDAFRKRLVRAFESRGYRAVGAATVDEALAAIAEHAPAMGVVDLRLGSGSGLELIRRAHQMAPDLRLIMLTGFGSIPTAVDSIKLGAISYLTKPVDVDQILQAFEPTEPDTARMPEPPSLQRVEWEHIQRVLLECGGNITQTARRLHLHRRTLQRKLLRQTSRF